MYNLHTLKKYALFFVHLPFQKYIVIKLPQQSGALCNGTAFCLRMLSTRSFFANVYLLGTGLNGLAVQ